MSIRACKEARTIGTIPSDNMDSATRMRKNGGKARASKLSGDQRSEIARQGGTARAAALTEDQRREAATAAVTARWAKKKKGKAGGRARSARQNPALS